MSFQIDALHSETHFAINRPMNDGAKGIVGPSNSEKETDKKINVNMVIKRYKSICCNVWKALSS